jgi:hypothetical protein
VNIKLKEEEYELILSALRCDRVGTWGDGREEAIQKLMKKLKRERANA